MEHLKTESNKDSIYHTNEKISQKYDRTKEYSRNKLNQSWDFTPFPKFLFPEEKKMFINDFNKLNFPGVKEESKYNSNDPSYQTFIEEIKGDVSKNRAPAYTFGLPRNECKVPFFEFNEKISPCPGSYNLRPLEGFGNSSSPKYSFNKKTTNKYKRITTDVPGPGQYHNNQCDIIKHGKYPLSTYVNTPVSGFGFYKEQRGKEFTSRYGFNIKAEPASYNTNTQVTMFNGTGKYPVSTFNSNISKSIANSKYYSRMPRGGVSPGPGAYNHHSIFIGGRYSK